MHVNFSSLSNCKPVLEDIIGHSGRKGPSLSRTLFNETKKKALFKSTFSSLQTKGQR